MNACEKLLRSAYGRPMYTMITEKKVPTELWCDIDDMLIIGKGIIEACVKDIGHTFCCYELTPKRTALR